MDERESLRVNGGEQVDLDQISAGEDREQTVAPKAVATLGGSISNLTNTILGAGMLGVPYALKETGLILGGILLFICACGAIFGLHLLNLTAKYTKREKDLWVSSYGAAAAVTFPRAQIVIDIAVAIKCFGVSISYLIVVGQLLPEAMRIFEDQLAPDTVLFKRTFWIPIIMIICGPLSYLKTMHSLRFTSYVAICSVVYVIVIVIYYFFQMKDTFPLSDYSLFSFNSGTFSILPVFVFSYTCHQNLFTIFNELNGNELKTNLTVVTSNIVSFCTYTILGYCGYLTFADSVASNVVQNLPKNPATFVCRIAVVLLVILSYPLQIHPCRGSVTNLVHRATDKLNPTILFIAITTTLCLTTFLVAFFLDNLTIVFSIIGATGSTTLCYILPGAFYVQLKSDEHWGPKKIAAAILCLLGIVFMINSLVFIAIDASTPHTNSTPIH